MPKKRPGGPWAGFAIELAARIRHFRDMRGFSQEQVAYAAGLSRFTYQKMEKGEIVSGKPVNPSLRNVMAVAQVFGVTLDELIPASWPDLQPGRVGVEQKQGEDVDQD